MHHYKLCLVSNSILQVYAEAVGIFVYHVLEFSEEVLKKFKKLKIIARLGTGYNNIDIKAAGELGNENYC